MGVKIELENLEELLHVVECVELCLKNDSVHPNNRKEVKKIAEKLRNDFENYSDLEKD